MGKCTTLSHDLGVFWDTLTTILWKKKKGTLPVVQNYMIIQRAEIPLLLLAQQTLKLGFQDFTMFEKQKNQTMFEIGIL